MIDFWKYYQKYLQYNRYEKIFDSHDPEFKKASKYLKSKRFLTINDLFEIARWKSPRRAKDTRNNMKEKVEGVTRVIFENDNLEYKIKELDNLKGIGIPIASAILCVYDPRNYGVVDIRAWNTLNKIDNSFIEKKYSNFGIKDYKKYLIKIRDLADKNKMTCRQIDMALWAWDKENKNMKNKYKSKSVKLLRKIFGKDIEEAKPDLCPECEEEIFRFAISCGIHPCHFHYICLKCPREIVFERDKIVVNKKLSKDELMKELKLSQEDIEKITKALEKAKSYKKGHGLF